MSSLYVAADYSVPGYDGFWLDRWQYAAELRVWDGSQEVTRYFSNEAFVTGASDTPAHIAFEPRIQQPALMRRDVFAAGQTFGASRVGYGELVLNNTDGGLDALLDDAMDGRRLIVRAGEPGTPYPAAWITVLTATMDAPAIEWSRVSIRLRDRLIDLQQPLQATLYAGDNALPDGLEGTEDDRKGQPKPLVYGQVANIAPPIVNTSRLIYQVNDGAVNTISAVYDRGVALTVGAAYASQAAMEADAPAAGSFRAWLAGGYFRLGSSPTGTLTADVTQGAAASNQTAAQVMKAVALRAGIAIGDIVSADVTALEAANSATVGLWLPNETSALAAMDAVANSVGAWWGFDTLGKLRMARMTLPSGTPAVVLDRDAVQKLDLQATASGDRNIPPSSIEIRYARNHTPQDDLAGSVTDERRAWLKEEWRTVTAAGASLTVHPLAEPLIMETLLVAAAAAQTEATRRAALFGNRRDRVVVGIRLDFARLLALDLGVVVRIAVPRFGYDAGKLFRVIGIQTDLRRNRAELTLWG
jgi:hypothetical protein